MNNKRFENDSSNRGGFDKRGSNKVNSDKDGSKKGSLDNDGSNIGCFDKRGSNRGDFDKEGEKLQKVLASVGVGSRRKVEEYIEQGRVQVNGKVANLGLRVDRLTDNILVDNIKIQTNQDLITIALNKPLNVTSAMSSSGKDKDRLNLSDIIPSKFSHLFHIGRLDYNTGGLLLLTNDGALAQKVAHPKFELTKTYLATIEGKLLPKTRMKLLKGVKLEDGISTFDKVRIIDQQKGYSLIEIKLHSGRNRIIRRTLREVGHKVVELCRIQVGPIKLGELKVGKVRVLNNIEIDSLLKACSK